MIVRGKPSPWELLFALRGSILPQIAGKIASVVVLSVIVVILYREGIVHLAAVAALPFSLIGIALSIFAGFRNSACYDRWWEGRKVWGQMIVDLRSLARQALVYRADDEGIARGFARQCIAFPYALRDHVRGGTSEAALKWWPQVDHARLRTARNLPNLMLHGLSREVASWLGEGRIAPQAAQSLEDRIVALSGALAASERLKAAPVPFAYSLLLHRTAYLFCLLLPFGLAGVADWWTPVAVAVVSYTFFGLDALGDELERPFGTGQNALPLDAMARAIEISILEMAGETELPPDLQPVEFILT